MAIIDRLPPDIIAYEFFMSKFYFGHDKDKTLKFLFALKRGSRTTTTNAPPRTTVRSTIRSPDRP